ncbi:MAG: XdhC family protein [Planctomyces sp.]|nr:XdhC family protein [Planctomyces sp.]
MRQVLEALTDAARRSARVVFTSLVETRGSTPQKAGAAMLVFPDGSQVGTLGGGCVEAEVKRKALALPPGGAAELLTFQLDSDYGWDDGLICGGRMRMLVDPVAAGPGSGFYQAYADHLAAGRGCTEAVALDLPDVPAGARWLFDDEDRLFAQTLPGDVPEAVVDGLRPLRGRPRPYVAGGVSYLTTLPRCRLIIVGGGHVGQKTAALAADVDFDVWVIDDRAEYCSEERFPRAAQRIAGPIEEVLRPLETSDADFGIIVTRGHNHDEEALLHLARKPFRYLGMIGSKRKIRMIFEDLEQAGVPRSTLERVHAPLGYDIGSQTVPEIAVSIVAELIAVRNRSEPSSPVRSMKDAVAGR